MGKNFENELQYRLDSLKYKFEISKDEFSDELASFKSQAKNFTNKRGGTLSSVTIDSIVATMPKVKDIDVYTTFYYEILVHYNGNDYKCSVDFDGNVSEPEYAISKKKLRKNLLDIENLVW